MTLDKRLPYKDNQKLTINASIRGSLMRDLSKRESTESQLFVCVSVLLNCRSG